MNKPLSHCRSLHSKSRTRDAVSRSHGIQAPGVPGSRSSSLLTRHPNRWISPGSAIDLWIEVVGNRGLESCRLHFPATRSKNNLPGACGEIQWESFARK